VDAAAKALVLRYLPGHPPVRLLGGLITLRLTRNPGAAFGAGSSYTVIIALVACAAIVFIVRAAGRLRSLGRLGHLLRRRPDRGPHSPRHPQGRRPP
jgi:signal peptidase II